MIERGTVAAQRFTWQGTVDGEPVITVRVNWLMGEEHLDPPWTLGEQRFEVEFDADAAGVVHVPRSAPAGGRRAPGDRADRAGDALRERDPLRRARPSPASRPTSTSRSSPAAPPRADLRAASNGIVNAGASTPPSTSKILPVTNDDVGDAR